MKIKTALIFGVSGQDGSYLSHLLLSKGYKVLGVTRDKSIKNLFRLKKLNIIKKVKLLKGEALNFSFCKKIINSKKYGSLTEIESFREHAPIRSDADVVWDLGVHDISILKYLLNSKLNKVNSFKYNTINNQKKDTAYINLHYKNNLKVFIKNSLKIVMNTFLFLIETKEEGLEAYFLIILPK